MSLKKISLVYSMFVFLYSCTTISVEKPVLPEQDNTLYERYIADAEAGDSEAMVQLGLSYEDGAGITKDYDKAYEWYKKAASKGNSHAYFRIGKCFEYGIAVVADRESAFEWYLSSAATGFAPAIGKMISYYDYSPEEQLLWIEKGLSVDDPYSNYRYGLLLERENKAGAIEYFKKAVDSDALEVRGLLSILSLSGQYSFYDEAKSLEYLLIGAQSGDSRSQTFLAWLYEFGILLKQNHAKAFNLYKSASDRGEILASYNLSRFYGEAIFVEKDPSLSRKYFKQIPEDFDSPLLEDLLIFCRGKNLEEQLIVLYRLKATGDDYDAYYNLGMLYEEEEAFHWFSMAAEGGHIPSMYELGKLFSNQNLSDYDPVRAAAWLMVYENRSDTVSDDISSSEIIAELTDFEKLEVSQLFTALFYNGTDRESIEENKDFIR